MNEAGIRADEQLHVLQGVLHLISELETADGVDPYLWGYGTQKVSEAIRELIRGGGSGM